ncbi:hypothetical protein AGIG_G19659 [Arapaima gigas]
MPRDATAPRAESRHGARRLRRSGERSRFSADSCFDGSVCSKDVAVGRMQRTLCVDPESHTLFLPGHGSPPNPHPGGGRKSPAKFNTFPASADSGDAKTNNRCSRPDGAEDTTADRHAIAKSTGVHASGNAVSSDLPTGGAPRGPEPEGRGAELLPPTAAVPKRTVAAPGAAGPTESIGLPRGRLRSGGCRSFAAAPVPVRFQPATAAFSENVFVRPSP